MKAFWSFICGMVLVMALTVFVRAQTTSSGPTFKVPPKFAVIYTVYHAPSSGIDPCAMQGACWTETKVDTFDSLKEAEDRLNYRSTWDTFFCNAYTSSSTFASSFSGQECLDKITSVNLVGLFELKSVPLHQERVGTEQRPVTRMEEVDKFEWRVEGAK